jgi:hypothetical protein
VGQGGSRSLLLTERRVGNGLKGDAENQALLPTLTSAASAGVDERPLRPAPQAAVNHRKITVPCWKWSQLTAHNGCMPSPRPAEILLVTCLGIGTLLRPRRPNRWPLTQDLLGGIHACC